MRKGWWIVLFLLVFWLAGYLREWFFVSVNDLIFYKYHQQTNPRPLNSILALLNRLDYTTLYYGKYVLTFLFAGLFFGLQFVLLYLLRVERVLIKSLVYGYILLVVVSGLTMVWGYLFSSTGLYVEYRLSRWLMGVAQSPIICLFLLAAEQLLKSNRSYEKR